MIGVRAKIIAAIGGAIALLVAAVIIFALNARLDLRTIERDNARDQAAAEAKAHAQTVANFRAASAAAKLAADRNVERVKADQAAITKGSVDDYKARLADVDARYERVRAQLAARTDLGGSDLAPMSIASAATCRAYGGGSCDDLLAKLRIAERQAWNLIALRKWVRDQTAVPFNPAAPQGEPISGP
ncbi:hypothetical protein FIM10_01765 [Sphingomonadales bacterium 56]|uniref:hypothetical protein n=1 Tax=unclassified Sphingobium TaxID=2611147 RepID=UPI001918FBAD|nr:MULTISPECIES: hypothetical protein [unclassified Sphingobium]MBY2927410.1 hypothetical protein [Sphingomonadales bacterium 56]MBY2957478.1 hypothetical protein [Sphingomonadales bacterium 58]MBY2957521.1 hypothetical protein [Sphingomonadales bacterium 58]CAD7335135.1 hypothetical protein SPHS8_00355 [Sphingobium sp. S8]CAD7335154.1 hypothetical protein SPHS6_00355 [Sphingobium sp. S6]